MMKYEERSIGGAVFQKENEDLPCRQDPDGILQEQGGQNQYTTTVVVEDTEFCKSKSQTTSQASEGNGGKIKSQRMNPS